jgi:hypothetical protein
MSARLPVVICLAAATLLSASAATAKDFGPGDLLICNATRCLPITNRAVLPLLGSFYYGGHQPQTAPSVRIGALAFELRFPPKPQGYVTGIVATPRLDRFLSYGVNMGRFAQGVWYQLPARLASELRRLTAHLRPLRVTPESLAKSN